MVDIKSKYYKSYMKKCKKAGLGIYLLEYTKDQSLALKAERYCDKMGYGLYISDSIKLN